MGRFDGKVVVITGGGQAMGEQFVMRFAREGAHVVVADIIQEKGDEVVAKLDRLGLPEAVFCRTDVTDEGMIRETVAKAHAWKGKIDFLVNNSGIMGPVKAVEEISREEWDATFAVNMTGMFLCTKHVLPIMRQQQHGSIVNVASVTGKRPLPLRSPYAATKMAVIGFTRTVAEEAGPDGIRVNAVCPGAITGGRQTAVLEGIAKARGIPYEEVVRSRLQSIPLREFIDPSEVAGVVAFLCSDDACKMTGQDLNVSAGAVMY